MALLLIEITSQDVQSFLTGVGFTLFGLAAIAGAIKAIRGEIWAPLKSWLLVPRQERRKKLDAVIAGFDAFNDSLRRIESEVMTNGGGSLKDTVLRIDRKTEHIQARIRHQDETSQLAIFEMDADGHITFANGALCDLVSADQAQLLHRNWLVKVHEDERRRVQNELDAAIDNRYPLDVTAHFRVAANQVIQLRLKASPHVRSNGELVGFFGTAARADVYTK